MRLSGEFLVAGPSSLILRGGRLEVLGADLGQGDQLVVPAGRQIPIVVDGDVELRGPEGSLKPLETGALRALEETYELLRGSGRALIIGPPDVGKSTLTAYLYNRGLYETLVTTDVGQNELYCPGFEAAARPQRPFVPGVPARAISSCFVGSFSPLASPSAYADCLVEIARNLGSFIVDTDGWIDYEALALKSRLAARLGITKVVSMGLPDEALRFLRESGLDVIVVSPIAAKSKSGTERRLHRDRLIASCLSGSRTVRLGPNVDIVKVGNKAEPRKGQLAAVSDGERDSFAVIINYDERRNYITLLTNHQGQVKKVKVGSVRVNIDAFRGLLG